MRAQWTLACPAAVDSECHFRACLQMFAAYDVFWLQILNRESEICGFAFGRRWVSEGILGQMCCGHRDRVCV